jgi:hypothetical protein
MVARVVAIVLAVGVSFDVYALNGQHIQIAERAALSVLIAVVQGVGTNVNATFGSVQTALK